MYVALHGLALILVSSKLHWTPRLGVKMVRIGLRISLSHILTVKASYPRSTSRILLHVITPGNLKAYKITIHVYRYIGNEMVEVLIIISSN